LQRVTLIFELVGRKDGSETAAALDDVVFGNVPALP